MRSLARWGSLPLLALPLSSLALTLHDIQSNSYLNQPLNAEIPLTATADELASLRVSLASVNQFSAQGLDYPSFLASVTVSLGQNAAGQDVITVTSSRPVTEPFVDLLVQVERPNGSSTRLYTLLLDPPFFLPEEATPAPIAAPEARETTPEAAGGQIQRPAPAAPAPAPAATTSPAPARQPDPQPVQSSTDGGDYTVQGGDTLWAIAGRYGAAGVSRNQAMMSIFDANPQAFDNNINRLRRGAILRIPSSSEQASVAAAAATAEVSRQIEAWLNDTGRAPELVLLPPSDNAASGNAAAGNAASDARVESLENEISELRSELASAESQLTETQRLLNISNDELANLQQQLGADTAADVAEPEPAADAGLEPDQIFVDDSAEEPVAAADDAGADEAVADAPPANDVRTNAVVTQQPSESIIDQIFAAILNPIVIGAGIAAGLLLGALAFLRRRRSDESDATGHWEALESEFDDDADHEATARMRARTAEPSMVVVEGHAGDSTAEEPRLSSTAELAALDSGTTEMPALDDPFAGAAHSMRSTAAFDDEPAATREPDLAEQTISSQTVINLDQADPIAEADFHMAYGLYDQAADLIAKALEAEPGDRALKLKLLEVLFVWGDKDQFLEAARDLRAEIGEGADADWDKVVIMGKQICPDEALFSAATTAAKVDLDLDSSGGSAGLDFAFDDDDDEVDLDLSVVEPHDMSSPYGGLEATTESVGEAAPATEMLDIGAQTQAGLEAALLEDFEDVTDKATPEEAISELERMAEATSVEMADFESDTESDADSDTDSEVPTIETYALDEPEEKTPTIETEAPDFSSIDLPAFDEPADEPAAPGGDDVEQMQTAAATGTSDLTAEIDIDDLGFDVGNVDLTQDIAELPDDSSSDRDLTQTASVESDAADYLLTATGVTQVLNEDEVDLDVASTALLDDDEATMMAPGFEPDVTGTTTEVLEQTVGDYEEHAHATEHDLDLNLDDLSSALDGGDTVEQPMSSRFHSTLDLNVGTDLSADSELTGTEQISPIDPQTMTEVGTKLDLARAYIDMGDPDGAKSILEEVLTEGDTGQRSEAQALLEALPA